jgi:hypothetical protein
MGTHPRELLQLLPPDAQIHQLLKLCAATVSGLELRIIVQPLAQVGVSCSRHGDDMHMSGKVSSHLERIPAAKGQNA